MIYAALFLLFLLIFFLAVPLCFQRVWKCTSLPDSELKERLDTLCARVHFRHGGMLIWNAFPRATTAAILGTVPKFRYLLFTERLLNTFPEEELEAVVAHEMGHAAHYHMVIYPFLFLGYLVLITSLPPFYPYLVWPLLFILYIRFFLSFFTRQFERQADLYVFTAALPAYKLSSALCRVSYLNSLPLKKKNWHHGSLDGRIKFLQRVEQNPPLAKRHHLKVRACLVTYLLVCLLCWIFLV